MDTATRVEAAARRRATFAFFATAAMMNAAMAAVSPASTIFASEYVGVTWSAFPQTLVILGIAAGALLVARATTQLGWRSSLIAVYAVATFGGVACFAAVLTADIPLLGIGMFALGLGAGGATISRYAVAELYPVHRRGYAIGLVVAAGAVGSVGGPLLLAPTGTMMELVGWPALSGPFLLAAVATALAGLGLTTLPAHRRREADAPQPAVLRRVFRSGPARTLLAVMVISQLVMLGIMSATPMDVHTHDGDISVVGTVLAAHIAGMFVLSPLTGWMIDRIGGRRMMFLGLVVLVLAAALGAIATTSQGLLGHLALFLLGLGWNLCFMAGSRTLAVTLPAQEQGQVVGTVDAVVWGVSATATLGGTALMSLGSFSTLSMVAGTLPVLGFVLLLRSRPVAAAARADSAPASVPEAGPAGPVPERSGTPA